MTDETRSEAFREALRKKIEGDNARQEAREEAAIESWLSGSRKPNSWYYNLSRFGCATPHYGDGCRIYRSSRDAVSQPLSKSQEREALELAVEVLNRFGFLLRYGGIATRNVTNQANSDKNLEMGAFADTAIADLGAALALLANFGGIAHPTPAERRHNERVMRSWQEERGHV